MFVRISIPSLAMSLCLMRSIGSVMASPGVKGGMTAGTSNIDNFIADTKACSGRGEDSCTARGRGIEPISCVIGSGGGDCPNTTSSVGIKAVVEDILQHRNPNAKPSGRTVVIFVASLLVGYAALSFMYFVRTSLASARRKRSAPFEGFDYFVPNPHWFLGHVGFLGTDFFSNIKKLCIDHANPSNGISTFWFFSVPALSVMRSKDAQRVLNTCAHRENPASLEKHLIAFVGKNSLLVSSGAEWIIHRRIVQRAFIPAALREMQASVCRVARRGVDTILRQIREQQARGEGRKTEGDPQCEVTLTMLHIFKALTGDFFGICAFGHDFRRSTTFGANSIVEAYEFLSEEFNRRLIEPWNPAAQHYWIPTPNNFRHWRANAKIRNYLGKVIQERRKEAMDSGDAKNDLLGRLISPSTDSDELSDEYLCDFLFSVLAAGQDTTSTTLSYAFYLLAKNPECQETCAEEVKKVLGPAPNMPESFHWSQLPYCQAVLCETLRLNPASTMTSRTLEKPLELDGFTFPRGARVFLFMWLIHRDPENFARPLEFLPERWVSLIDGELEPHKSRWAERTPERENNEGEVNEGNESTAPDAIPAGDKKAMFAFSGGARSCSGERFAMQSATITLATFIRELSVRIVPGYVLQNEKKGIQMSPSQGLPMLVRKR